MASNAYQQASHPLNSQHPSPHPYIQPQPRSQLAPPSNSASSGSGCPLCGSLCGNRTCGDGFCKRCCQNAKTINPGRKLCNEHKHQLNLNATDASQHVTGAKIHIPPPQHVVPTAPQQHIDPSLSFPNVQFPSSSTSFSPAPQQQVFPGLCYELGDGPRAYRGSIFSARTRLQLVCCATRRLLSSNFG